MRLGAANQQAVDVLARMQTNTQARGVLGIAAKWLRQAFGILDTFPFGTGQARESARDLLTRTNNYAMQVYAKLPDDQAMIDPAIRKQIVTAVNQAATNLRLVSNEAQNLNQGMIEDLVDYLYSKANQFIDDTVRRVTGSGSPVHIPKALIWGVVAVAGVTALFVTAKLVHTVMLGGADLEEAEETAMALADAQKR